MTNSIRPLILITNDDGIHSPGILALAEAVYSLADLVVIAPKSQQTNMGRGSLNDVSSGIIHETILETCHGNIKGYAIEGSPAQAVAHGLLELCDRKPTLCLSGINYGENLGLAFTCSGTLGAIFEADSFDVPGIAFSRVIPFEDQREDRFADLHWDHIKTFVKNIVENSIHCGFGQAVRMLNVNFPASVEKDTPMRLTEQAYMNCGRYVRPNREKLEAPFKLKWEINEAIDKAAKETDIYAVHKDGVTSITPLTAKMSVKIENDDFVSF